MFYVGFKCGSCPRKYGEVVVNSAAMIGSIAVSVRNQAVTSGFRRVPEIGLCCPECVRIAKTDSLVPDSDAVMAEQAENFVLQS